MPETIDVKDLPDIDQWEIKRGRCPFCSARLFSLEVDQCEECFTIFLGTLTIED